LEIAHFGEKICFQIKKGNAEGGYTERGGVYRKGGIGIHASDACDEGCVVVKFLPMQ
jgi:hypothetical protein